MLRVSSDAVTGTVLIEQAAPGEGASNAGVFEASAASRWHLVDTERNRSLCGREIPDGARGATWSQTPLETRCHRCIDRLVSGNP
jgi:hypothetical protein